LEWNLTVGADSDPRAHVGVTVAVAVERDQAMKPLTGLEIDQPPFEPVLEAVRDVNHLTGRSEHELGSCGLVLAGIHALECQRRTGDQDRGCDEETPSTIQRLIVFPSRASDWIAD
jgi:hypothetical protein